MGETFFLLTSRLRHNNSTFISRIVNCLVLHTNAFTKILNWRNILYLSNLTKIIQHSSVLTKECKKKKKKKNTITCPNRERVTFLIEDPNAMYKFILPPLLARESLYQQILCEKLTLISFFHTQGNTIACKY